MGSCPVTRFPCDMKGWQVFEHCCTDGKSLKQLGILLAWTVVQGGHHEVTGGKLTALSSLLPVIFFQGAGMSAVHRSLKRGTLPLRLGRLEDLVEPLMHCSHREILGPDFSFLHGTESWKLLSLLYINWLHGCRGAPRGRWRKCDLVALLNIEASVQRVLRLDHEAGRTAAEVEKELKNRYVTYTGEEVPKMESLSFEQIFPALPPEGHGGSISVLEWTKGRTRTFLNRPSECIAPDEGQSLPKLQARVHIQEGDRMRVAELLVKRKICDWVELDHVMEYRGQKVLNGLFGVAKAATLPDSRPHLRVIMNLIPSNSVMIQLAGSVQELPSISQYMSLTLSEDESSSLAQSDMVSAFYLFALPPQWKSFLAFNLVEDGSAIGKVKGRKYALACCVLPMGWSSAVSVMQEISQQLLERHGFSRAQQVLRTRPLPSWMTSVMEEAGAQHKAWFHVYLDNFFAGEKVKKGSQALEVEKVHQDAEAACSSAGVLSSEKKRIRGAPAVEELGANLDGVSQLVGASAGRLLRLLQTTCLLLSRTWIPRKWLQVVMGRWVHVLQFRRPGMAGTSLVWRLIAGKKISAAVQLGARVGSCCIL